MLHIIAPRCALEERAYIFKVVLSVFLGVEYSIEYADKLNYVGIRGDKGTLKIADVFFPVASDCWLEKDSLPICPLERVDFTQKDLNHIFGDIPIIYGQKNDLGEYIAVNNGNDYLGIDVFGASFFMLTRYEECVLLARDDYDRFPVEESLAYKEKFLDRAIVNEYVELLWYFLQRTSSELKRKPWSYKVIPTHDVDKPFGMMYDSYIQILRHFAGDLFYKKSLVAMIMRLKDVGKILFKPCDYINEKKETFQFIINQSKIYGLKDIFFFMNSKKSWYDGNYTVEEVEVKTTIEQIVEEGHLVGLHPSFESYDDAKEIKCEAESMNAVLEALGLPPLVGARQHYLKWRNPDTWQYYEDAGIPFDSTITFAGAVGFRAGVCYPYPAYNLVARKKMNLVERPLIVMDGTLYEYMKLSHPEAMKVVKKLADECRKYNGEFVILWHNTTLDNKEEQKFYASMLNEVCSEAVE